MSNTVPSIVLDVAHFVSSPVMDLRRRRPCGGFVYRTRTRGSRTRGSRARRSRLTFEDVSCEVGGVRCSVVVVSARSSSSSSPSASSRAVKELFKSLAGGGWCVKRFKMRCHREPHPIHDPTSTTPSQRY